MSHVLSPSSVSSSPEKRPDPIQKSSQEVETMFMSYMMNQIFSQNLWAEPGDGLCQGGIGEELMKPFQVEEMTKMMTSQGVGIAPMVQKSLLSLQEIEQ